MAESLEVLPGNPSDKKTDDVFQLFKIFIWFLEKNYSRNNVRSKLYIFTEINNYEDPLRLSLGQKG
jgi:hypothetical protein